MYVAFTSKGDCPYRFSLDRHPSTKSLIDFQIPASPEHLETFRNFLNGQHANMSFTIANEK